MADTLPAPSEPDFDRLAIHAEPGTDADDQGRLASCVLEQVRELRAVFDAKIRNDQIRERLVGAMSDEVESLRSVQQDFRQLLLDVIALYDDLTIRSTAAGCPPETAGVLEFFRDSVEETLLRNRVEKYSVTGESIDRARQKVIEVVATEDPARNRRLAHRIRPGFTWNDKNLRPEWVSAYRCVDVFAAKHVTDEGVLS